MRSIEDQMTEITRRRVFYTDKRQLSKLRMVAVILGLLLMGMILLAPGVTGSISPDSYSYYGATILGPEAGGYVIVAILAFSLGIAVCMLIRRKKDMDKPEKPI